MAHKKVEQYRSRGNEYTIVCGCGWKEKARTEKEVEGRFERHAEAPHHHIFKVMQ